MSADNFGVDPSLFYAPEPLWVVAVKSTLEQDAAGGETFAGKKTAVMGVERGQDKIVLLFSGEDLAERFVANRGDDSLTPGKIRRGAHQLGGVVNVHHFHGDGARQVVELVALRFDHRDPRFAV